MYCPRCGAQLPDTAKMCYICKTEFQIANPALQPQQPQQPTMNYGQPQPQQTRQPQPTRQPYQQQTRQPYPQQMPAQRGPVMNGGYPKQKGKSKLVSIVVGVIACILVIGLLGSMGNKDKKDRLSNDSKSVAASGNNVSDNVTEEATTEEVTEAPIASVSVEEQVIFDSNDIKITVTGLEDGFYGTDLKVLIENNSDKGIMVQTRDSNVNGYMVDTMFSPDVAAGKKVNDEITFMTSGLKDCGIEDIASMEFKLIIIDGDTWNDIEESEIIKIDTSIADGYVQNYDDSGNVVVDYNNIKIVEKGLSKADSFWGPGVILYIENNSDQDITVQVRDVSINGFMVDSMMSQDVVIGKKAVTDIQFISTDLEKNGITEINDVEFSFHIFNWDTFDTIYDSDVIKLSY